MWRCWPRWLSMAQRWGSFTTTCGAAGEREVAELAGLAELAELVLSHLAAKTPQGWDARKPASRRVSELSKMENILGGGHLERELTPEPLAGPAAGAVGLHVALLAAMALYGAAMGLFHHNLWGSRGTGGASTFELRPPTAGCHGGAAAACRYG